MTDLISMARGFDKKASQRITRSDADATGPAIPLTYSPGDATSPFGTPATRRSVFMGTRAASNVFFDLRKIIGGAGANLYGRILRWFEMSVWAESVDFQSGTSIKIDPSKANNTIAKATGDATIVLPLTYSDLFGDGGIVGISDVEESLGGDGTGRARLVPHLLYFKHGGFKIVGFTNGVLGDGDAIPTITTGTTLVQMVYMQDPDPGQSGTGQSLKAGHWLILGFKHFAVN